MTRPLRRLRAVWGRLTLEAEEVAARLRPPKHRFFVVTAAHQAEGEIERCLSSVARQRYPSQLVEHLVFDDASTDATSARVEGFIADHPTRGVELVTNVDNRGGCANLTEGFRRAPPGSIVLQVDGDDALSDPGVFSFLNHLYASPRVWMTYNTWRFFDGSPSPQCAPIPREALRKRRLRDLGWVSSHLHSFRAELFAHVDEQDMIDPSTGDYWRASVDLAQYLPMLEMAGPRARHLDRITYLYNLHEGSLFNARRHEQVEAEKRIRSKRPYPRLRRLEQL